MNRREFMSKLSQLLSGVPIDDKNDALQYYEDYFDDAGADREQEVIRELESPERVAKTIRSNLGYASSKGEYTETGYSNSEYDKQKETPVDIKNNQKAPRGDNNKIMKIILTVLVIIVGAPIIIPVAVGVIATIFGLLVAAFGIFLSLVIISICLIIVGVALIVVGCICLIPQIAVGITLIGSGLVLVGSGVIATYGSIKLCVSVFPAMIRFIVEICKKPFNRKAVA
ncbi:MAG: DUF1700 domain-containing protein [Suipraeoptans sp.]